MTTQIIYGERIAKNSQLRLSCTAAIYDRTRQKMLLVRRRDNAAWCLPGGALEAGESVAECCIREVREETGLEVEIASMLGVYSSPNFIIEYSNGRQVQIVAMLFEAQVLDDGAGLAADSEMSEVAYFTQTEASNLPLLDTHRERIQDAYDFAGKFFLK